MNIKRLFLTFGLAIAACGSSLFCLNNNKSMNVAKAEVTPSNTTIYVEVEEGWHAASAAIRLYVSSIASSFIKPTTVKTHIGEQNALYSFNVPANVSSFFIYRMNPDNPDAAGGVWNSTKSIDYSHEYNYYHVTGLNGYDCPYTSGWMNVFYRGYDNHQDFRLTVINEDYNWFADSASTYIRFWDGTEIRFDKYISYYKSAIYTNTLTCSTQVNGTAPTIYAAGFNIFRKSSDGSETWSQTGNWVFTYDNKDMNAFVIKAKDGDAQFYDGQYQSKVLGAEYNAMAYSIFFLETTNPICNGKEDDDNSSALAAVWDKLYGAANGSTNSNFLLKSEEEIAAFEESNEFYTHEAYVRYTHIISRYQSLNNYLGITPSSTNRIAINNVTNGMLIVIISVSVVAISLVGVALIINKRKKTTK